MDVEKQVAYWRAGSEEDFAAALSLLESQHVRHALFSYPTVPSREDAARQLAEAREVLAWLQSLLP